MLLSTYLRTYFMGLTLLSFTFMLSGQTPLLQKTSANNDAEGLECGQSSAHELLMQKDPLYAQRLKLIEEAYYKYAKDWLFDNPNPQATGFNTALANTRVVTIPVVVHVMHLSGTAIGTAENVSDAQIQAGIQHLNNAFAKIAPYNTGPLNSNAGITSADIEIQFCLATIDPMGNATTGITRHATTYSNLYRDDIVTASTTQDAAMKALAYWNSAQYMNFYLVKEIYQCSSTAAAGYTGSRICPANQGIGIAGYAYYSSAHGQTYDGVVNEAAYFGSNTNSSKIHIHEVGHYLNLAHTFEGGCGTGDCYSSGDNVCDTPPDNSTAGVSCASSATANSCSNDATLVNSPFTSDVQDLYEDYMDYGFNSCQNTFTPGQKLRMRQAMFTTRKSLLTSGKCGSTTSWVDAVLNTVTSPSAGASCVSTFTPQITVSNNGNTTITAMVITATLGTLTLTNNWTGTLNVGASTSISFSTMTLGATAQSFVIQITSVNGQGIDTNESNNNSSFLVGPVTNQTPPVAACPIAGTNTSVTNNFDFGIYNVTFGSINMSSAGAYDDGKVYDDRTCSNYATFSSPNTSSSVTTSFSVTVGRFNTENVKVFIDLNNNNTFVSLLTLAGTGVLTGNITIPSTVTRNTLLRLRVVSSFSTPAACTTPNYGQVEDYGIIISTPTALAVEFVSFNAKNKDDRNFLNWQTASEINNSHFIIQKSKDGQNFVDIGTVKGHGTTTTPQYYEFVDVAPYSGLNYYRLQQFDTDGKMEYSKIISVVSNSDKQQEVKIYPNPTQNLLTVEHATITESFDVLNALGQVVKTIQTKPEAVQTTISTSDLDNGIYFLRIHTANGLDKAVKTIRFVKL